MLHSTPPMTGLSRRLEQWFRVERAILVGRAANGLVAALLAWRSGRANCRVAMPGAICHEVLLAVLTAGCQPVFCDVEVATGLAPNSEWARARAGGAEAAIVAHLYGNPVRMNEIRSIFPAPQCLVIDDAAQALGSHSQDGLCGSLGDVGLLSFGHSKQISIGNGAILVRNGDFAGRIEASLPAIDAHTRESKLELQKIFRSKLDAARDRLTRTEVPDAGGFAGLLDGSNWMLDVRFDNSLTEAVCIAVAGCRCRECA